MTSSNQTECDDHRTELKGGKLEYTDGGQVKENETQEELTRVDSGIIVFRKRVSGQTL